MQVWLTNVIGFGLLFWELDRGGPVRAPGSAPRQAAGGRLAVLAGRGRRHGHRGGRDVERESGWIPIFLDYLYLSVTNSSAFSPTDTMPLTNRAKILMAIEATAALLTSLLIIARAVGSLGTGG